MLDVIYITPYILYVTLSFYSTQTILHMQYTITSSYSPYTKRLIVIRIDLTLGG